MGKTKKIAYLSVKGKWDSANNVSNVLPNVDSDVYLMEQIKKMKLFPIKKHDFLIVSTELINLKKTMIELYKKDVRMFITTATTSNLALMQDILITNKMTDAFIFDSSSTANLPRLTNPPNVFRLATIDAAAVQELLYLFLNVLGVSAMITDNSAYATNLANILKSNGVVLIEPNDSGNYEPSQFDNYNVIFVLAVDINFLLNFNEIAKKFNSPKVLYLSDDFNFRYNSVIYSVAQNMITDQNVKSYSSIFSWSSAHVGDYLKLSKIIFDGKIINTLILDSLLVLEYVFRVYAAQFKRNKKNFNASAYLFKILKKTGTFYTTDTQLYNTGDHITVNYLLSQVSIKNSTIEWTLAPVNTSTRVTRYPELSAYLSTTIDPNLNPASNVQGLDTIIVGNNTFAYVTNDTPPPEVKSILYMIALPDDYTVELKGRVYMLNINFKIFKSKLNGTSVSDEIIEPLNLSFVFDTTWIDKLRPNDFTNPVEKIYYTSKINIPKVNSVIPLANSVIPKVNSVIPKENSVIPKVNSVIPNTSSGLDITYDIILDTANNNLIILFRTNYNEYYIFTSEVVINSVYPKISGSGDFKIKYSSYKLPNNNILNNQQLMDITKFAQNTLYPPKII